jgi:hypothetical protein
LFLDFGEYIEWGEFKRMREQSVNEGEEGKEEGREEVYVRGGRW